jgi:hypothetical protein
MEIALQMYELCFLKRVVSYLLVVWNAVVIADCENACSHHKQIRLLEIF